MTDFVSGVYKVIEIFSKAAILSMKLSAFLQHRRKIFYNTSALTERKIFYNTSAVTY